MPAPKPRAALDQQFAEAVAFFRRKTIVAPDVWATYDAAAKRRAFSVAGITQRDILHDVWKAIDRALAQGTDFRAFQAEVGEKLQTAWGGSVANPGWRLRTIFRTNVQTSYLHGRVEAALHPDVRAARPLWQFNAIDDGRTTPICRDCDGTIRDADDAWWKSHTPPLHFSCRSGFITLTNAQGAERGGVTRKPTATKADEGFGDLPAIDDIDAVAEAKNADLPPELRPSGATPKPRTPLPAPAATPVAPPPAQPPRAPTAPPPAAPPAPPGQKPPVYPPVDPAWPVLQTHPPPHEARWSSQLSRVGYEIDAAVQQTFGPAAPSPDDLAAVYSTPGNTVRWESASSYRGNVSLAGFLEDDTGQRVARIQRTFSRSGGALKVDHDFLRFDDPSKQGSGAGAKMAKQAMQAYIQMGTKSVEVHAAWIGRYTWSSFGYEWRAEDGALMQPLMRRFFAARGIDAAVAEKMADKYAKRGGNVALSQLKVKGVMLGKEFLLDPGTPMWTGDLTFRSTNRGFKRASKRLGLYDG